MLFFTLTDVWEFPFVIGNTFPTPGPDPDPDPAPAPAAAPA